MADVMTSVYFEHILGKCRLLSIRPTARCLYVAIPEQTLYVYIKRSCALTYRISTSERPPSCQKNSYGTPLGLHKIADKIGGRFALGTVFKARQSTGKRYWHYDSAASNLITTRILRLRGLEPEKNQGGNCDTYHRYIYIHGTNQEATISRPISAGCVLMRNQDIRDLYREVPSGSVILIKNSIPNEVTIPSQNSELIWAR